MNKIRYVQRECKDTQKIDEFLSSTRVGILGMNDDKGKPYAVPLNFVWFDGSLFFHGAGSGKKEIILDKEPQICFTVYEEYGTAMDPMPCHADTSYMSVMLFGKVERVINFGEAAQVLDKLVEKYVPGYYTKKLTPKLMEKYRSQLDGKAVSVYRITPEEITAKQNIVQENELFNGK